MARSSYPQQGLFPGDGPDCGPYTANEWRAWILTAMRAGGMVNTGAAAPPGLPATPLFPSVGVFYVCPDRLLVEENPANTIRIGTGAWLCDGTFGYNDTQITGIVPAVGVRTDYVIVRQNYSGADFNTGPAGAALTVTDNTADVTIIDSANFTQDQDRATYWDIPLASYDIDGAGVITNLTDLREWVDAETKELYVPALIGYNQSLASDISLTRAGGASPSSAIVFPDNNVCTAYGKFTMLQDYISTMTITTVTTPFTNAFGNIYRAPQVTLGECGQSPITHVEPAALAYAAEAVAANVYGCVGALSIPDGTPSLDDIVDIRFNRDGTHVNDTLGAALYVHGFIVEYLGWGRR